MGLERPADGDGCEQEFGEGQPAPPQCDLCRGGICGSGEELESFVAAGRKPPLRPRGRHGRARAMGERRRRGRNAVRRKAGEVAGRD